MDANYTVEHCFSPSYKHFEFFQASKSWYSVQSKMCAFSSTCITLLLDFQGKFDLDLALVDSITHDFNH